MFWIHINKLWVLFHITLTTGSIYLRVSDYKCSGLQPNLSQTPADLSNIFWVWCGGPNISRPIQPDSTLVLSETTISNVGNLMPNILSQLDWIPAVRRRCCPPRCSCSPGRAWAARGPLSAASPLSRPAGSRSRRRVGASGSAAAGAAVVLGPSLNWVSCVVIQWCRDTPSMV